MTADRNFLLGNGDVLSSPVTVGRRIEEKPPPYTVEEARTRVLSMVRDTAAAAAAVPDSACPDDYAVAILTLHPQYTAKTFFPEKLLQEARLTPVGSRLGRVQPERMRDRRPPPAEPLETVELFVAGRRADMRRVGRDLTGWTEAGTPAAAELFMVERLRAAGPADRLRPLPAGPR